MQKKHSLVSLNKATGNIMNDKLIEKWIIKFNPDFIINAAAYTNVEKAETNKTEAYNVNSEAVLNLSKLSKKYDCTLIHFSTDYVFDGNETKLYETTDIPNPINVYGKSKLQGEINIKEQIINFLLLE